MSILRREKPRQVPFKNYIYLALILIATFLILIYIYKWHKTYQESKLNTSIMSDYLTVINYNELDDYIIENKDAVIYVSILGNKEIHKFETSFKNTIQNNNLTNSMLYLDITNENIELAESKLNIDKNLPYIVVYTNGKISNTYSISKNNYNTKKIIKYLNRIGATDND